MEFMTELLVLFSAVLTTLTAAMAHFKKTHSAHSLSRGIILTTISQVSNWEVSK